MADRETKHPDSKDSPGTGLLAQALAVHMGELSLGLNALYETRREVDVI
jgi:hypothetical protein